MMQWRAKIIQGILILYTLAVGFLSVRAWSDEFLGEPRAYRILLVIGLSVAAALLPGLFKQETVAKLLIQISAVTLLTVMWYVVWWSV